MGVGDLWCCLGVGVVGKRGTVFDDFFEIDVLGRSLEIVGTARAGAGGVVIVIVVAAGVVLLLGAASFFKLVAHRAELFFYMVNLPPYIEREAEQWEENDEEQNY